MARFPHGMGVDLQLFLGALDLSFDDPGHGPHVATDGLHGRFAVFDGAFFLSHGRNSANGQKDEGQNENLER